MVGRLKLVPILAIISIVIIVLLSWRLNVANEHLSTALIDKGELQQSNNQYRQDLSDQQNRIQALLKQRRDEQHVLSSLAHELDLAKQNSIKKQKVVYVEALKSECGDQSLPIGLVNRLRERATTPTN